MSASDDVTARFSGGACGPSSDSYTLSLMTHRLGRRLLLSVVAATVVAASAACEPPPPAVVTPSWPPPALAAVPAAGIRSVQVFVVGDSWAQMGNEPGVWGQVLAPPLGQYHLVDGSGAVRAAFSAARDAAGQPRFDVAQVQSWGIGGSVASNWATGRPCDDYVKADIDPIVEDDDIARMYSLGCVHMMKTSPTPDLVTALVDQIETSPQQPVVYLSLGGNDIVFRMGRVLDLRGNAGTLPRELGLGLVQADLEVLISRILQARPDADVILSGYSRVNGQVPCGGLPAIQQCWRDLFKWTPTVTEAEVDAILAGSDSATTPLSSSRAGLNTVAARLEAAHPGQVFASRGSNFGGSATFIASAARFSDFLHMKTSDGTFRRFVDGVVNNYRP